MQGILKYGLCSKGMVMSDLYVEIGDNGRNAD